MIFLLGIFGSRSKGLAEKKEIKEELPNIIVFVADDANWNDFGAYGNQSIRTPHIDRLADNGLKINKAFLTVAQCSPARISILTGMTIRNL